MSGLMCILQIKSLNQCVYFHGCFKFSWKYFLYILFISLLQPLLICVVSDREEAEVCGGLRLFSLME